MILWTNRCDELLEKAIEWCEGYGLIFDAVNENLSERVEKYGNDCRKISADIYIDDKAVQTRFDEEAGIWKCWEVSTALGE